MADYDYIEEGDRFVTRRREQYCLSDLLTNINHITRLSFFAFPKGNLEKKNTGTNYRMLEWPSPILPEFSTKEKSGAELWAEFLGVFTPATSYMENYDEAESLLGKNTPMCEFRLEQPKTFKTSAIIRQCWLNGVRYSFEEPNTEIAKFCLTFWEKEMRPHQAFQLYLLGHALTNGQHGHVSYAQNAYFCDEKKYRELLTENGDPYEGTRKLGRGYQRNDKYNIKYNPSALAVQRAWNDAQNGNRTASFQDLVAVWRKES